MKAANPLTRRQSLVLLCACAASPVSLAAPAKLPTTSDLRVDLARALANRKPLVVMVSLEGCPFCKIARESYLSPMHEREGLAIVQIDMRNPAAVSDFAGKAWTQDDLIRNWGVKVAPTLLFFGPNGREIAERMEGGYLPDFYGAYLDGRLSTARAALPQ